MGNPLLEEIYKGKRSDFEVFRELQQMLFPLAQLKTGCIGKQETYLLI